MFLLQSQEVYESGPLEGLALTNKEVLLLLRATLKQLLFNLCKDCQDRGMACVPPSAFTAKHIRASQSMKVSNMKNKEEPSAKYFHTNLPELNPLQYNSKMMNSVWGLYNRYSSHNVKTNNDVFMVSSEAQLPPAASSTKTERKSQPAKANFDNIWAAFNFSQSH